VSLAGDGGLLLCLKKEEERAEPLLSLSGALGVLDEIYFFF
jgi:hypothetical protein